MNLTPSMTCISKHHMFPFTENTKLEISFHSQNKPTRFWFGFHSMCDFGVISNHLLKLPVSFRHETRFEKWIFQTVENILKAVNLDVVSTETAKWDTKFIFGCSTKQQKTTDFDHGDTAKCVCIQFPNNGLVEAGGLGLWTVLLCCLGTRKGVGRLEKKVGWWYWRDLCN